MWFLPTEHFTSPENLNIGAEEGGTVKSDDYVREVPMVLERAQGLRALVALSKDPGFILSTRVTGLSL